MTAYDNLTQLITIRHSEARKTERRVHGGPGTPLTDRGRTDTVDLAAHLRRRKLVTTDTQIFTGPRPQSLETAEILGRELNIEICALDALRNISMGIFDGLTDDEARARDPDAMKRLELWRSGDLPVGDIEIPGAEDLAQFVTRIHEALIEMTAATRTPIVIVTRSLGIALHNLVSCTFNWVFENYKRVRLDPGCVSVYRRDEGGRITEVALNGTEYLKVSRDFADD